MRAVGGVLATHAEAVVPRVLKNACHAVESTSTRQSMLPKLRQGACRYLQRCTVLLPALMLMIQDEIIFISGCDDVDDDGPHGGDDGVDDTVDIDSGSIADVDVNSGDHDDDNDDGLGGDKEE